MTSSPILALHQLVGRKNVERNHLQAIRICLPLATEPHPVLAKAKGCPEQAENIWMGELHQWTGREEGGEMLCHIVREAGE